MQRCPHFRVLECTAVYRGVLISGVGIEEFHCIQRCPHFRVLESTHYIQRCPHFRVGNIQRCPHFKVLEIYRGVFISEYWNREVHCIQGVGLEESAVYRGVLG